jgi:hypothetical protein
MVVVRARDLLKAQALLEQMDHDCPISIFNLGICSPMIRTEMAVSHGESATQGISLTEPALS